MANPNVQHISTEIFDREVWTGVGPKIATLWLGDKIQFLCDLTCING